MKKLLLLALLPLILTGASLTPIGAVLPNGSGGILRDDTWYSREAMPLDDGRVLYIGRNPTSGNTSYTATMIDVDGRIGIVRHGYIASYIGAQANNNWNVFAMGHRGLYGTISYFNENAFLYVSDDSAGIYALMVEGLPLQGKLQSEDELAVMRIAASGNGKVVVAQVASHEMNVFTRGSDGNWTNTVKETEDFTAELYRGIALDYEGKRMWRFERQEQDCWLMFTETADDGAENTVAVMKVDDGAQHAYYVACPDNGNIVYFTCYLNGKSMLMKGVYEDGTFQTQLISQDVDGVAANGDSRSPACSADGRFVVFASKAMNLTADVVDGEQWQIFVYDSLRNKMKLMSALDGVPSNADCETPSISPEGRYVTFTSAATNLGVATSTVPHLYRAGCENVDMTQGVVAADATFERIAVSDDGDKVVFATTAVLDILDNNTLNNVYERDTAAGVTFAVSPMDSLEYRQCAISGDGKTAVCVPFAGDENEWPGLGDYSDVCSMSLDFDGDVLAYIDMNGRLLRQERGKPAVVLATDATNTTGASSAVRLNHEGRILVYTCKLSSGKIGLKAWFAESGQFVTLTEDSPQYVHLTLSGRYVFYRKSDYKLYRQAISGGAAEVVVSAGDIFAVSRDGRYAFHDTQTSTQLVMQELFGDRRESVIGDCNGTRHSTIGVSADGGVVYYVANGALVYDTTTTADDGTITVTGTCAEDVMENTGDDPVYEIALEHSGNADYALRLVGETSVEGGSVSLIYPDETHPWYALNYVPKTFFCGKDTVQVELWDGKWISANVEITVENVNNPPEWTEETVSMDVTEGEVSTGLNMVDYIVDHDWDYWEITGESLSLNVHGPDAANLLSLTNGVLVADLTGRYDLVARGGGVLEYTATVKDAAGETAVMTVQLNITNTDLPPTLSKGDETAYEGLPIEWSWFVVADPDREDTEDNLRLCFQSRHAEFYGNDGKKLDAADGVLKSQFPITYHSTCNIQQDTVSVWAKDLDGLTSESVSLPVIAAYLETDLADMYGGYDDEGNWGWSGVKEGWNLLSVPCDVSEDDMMDYMDMLGIYIIWRWNNGRFEMATSLKGDEGFWAYIDRLPDTPQGMLNGRREFTSLRKGWNLRGAYGASQAESFWKFEKGKRHDRFIQTSEASKGFGHWIFVK